MTTTKDKDKESAGKRKRAEEDEVTVVVKNKKPYVAQQQEEPPGGIISAALQKIAELEKYINEVEEEEEHEDEDNLSDYSDVDSEANHGDTDSVQEEVAVRNLETASFNPEIVGFAICAQEAIDFLKSEGFSDQNPLIVNMKDRLLNQLSDYQSTLQVKRANQWMAYEEKILKF